MILSDNNITMSYSQVKKSPHFLMEVPKGSRIPQLVSIHDPSPKRQLRDKLLKNARQQPIVPRQKPPQQITNLRLALESQRAENEQLKSLIKQLTVKSDKLREMNQHLISRIGQIQSSYRMLRSELDKQFQEEKRRLKSQIYEDIQEYIKSAIWQFTQKLRTEKMTPRIEQKVETFLAELMEINAVSVENLAKKERLENMESQKNNLTKNINLLLEKEFRSQNKYTSLQIMPSHEQYASIMQRLGGHTKIERMARSQAGMNDEFSSISKNKFRNDYATTPQKRRKIFD